MRPALACAASVIALGVYLSNGETISSYDAVPNSLLAFDLFAAGRLDFDRLRNGYFVPLGGQYAFAETPSGHLVSLFPVGTAIVTAPIYAALYAARAATSQATDITLPAFEPVRLADEKLAAAIVAAVAVGLFFACASSIAALVPAALATAAFAFGTETWMIGSQGLWQHGSVELVLLAMIGTLLQAARATSPRARIAWLVAAGICMGLLPVVRPTAALFTLAGLVFAGVSFGRHALAAAGGALLGLAPGLAWNWTFFHSLLGGYAANAQWYSSAPGAAATALAGLTVSMSRGILVFTPLVVLGAIGLVHAARTRTAPARLLTLLSIASLLLMVNYAWFSGWIGGDAYGPRFLCDCMPVAMLLLLYVPASSRAVAAFAVLFVWSIGVQAAGAYSGAAGPLWNAVPISLARAPERVWHIADGQIERNARGAYYRYVPDYPTGGPGYVAGFAGHVTGMTRRDSARSEPLAGRPGEAFAVAAALQNTGRSRWFGYASAVYNNEARVRARIIDVHGNLVAEEQLYVDGNVAPGARARAIGTLTLPNTDGAYTLVCDVIALGAAVTRHDPPFRAQLDVGERLASTENRELSP